MPYHIEYAKSGRAKCKGPKKTCPSEDRSIKGGDLRLGSEIESTGFTGVAWRHWKCTTPKVLEHLSGLDSLEDLVGFSELHEEDQERVRKAVEEGHVSETEGDDEEEKKEEEKPKAKPKASKKASKKETNNEDASEEKPEPKKRGRKPKAATDESTKEAKPSAAKKRKEKDTTEQETAAPKKKRVSKKASKAAEEATEEPTE